MPKKKEIILSQDMLDNIKNYGEEVVTIEDDVLAIRQNIGMYIGSAGDKGFINMVREIVQNSLDELNKPSSPCTYIIVSFDELTKTIIVEDNGRGIPFGNIVRIFSRLNTSSNYKKKKGEFSSGLHGVGAKVTNALSKKFIVESYILGGARRVEFDDGKPWKLGEKKIPNKENKQGALVSFTPSMEVLGELSINWKNVYNLIKLILPLQKLGATIYFNAIDINGKAYKEKLVNEDGIITYIINDCKKPLVAPVHLFDDNGTMKMDVMFTYDVADMGPEHLMAFCNTCPTSQGHHIEGFLKGIQQYFVKYMNDVYLANSRTKLKVVAADVRTGLKAVISAAHLEPMFNGQAKEILEKPEMEPYIKNKVIEGLKEWEKTNPNDLQKICKYLKDVAEIRTKADKEKIKINNKYVQSVLSGLPAKYVKPTGKKNLELWICEGDSAGSTLLNNRINERQGYFPIRGKLPNAFNWPKEKFLSNNEIAGIIAIIGGGYGKSFDINKVKWEKIIIGTDADADGYHIASLIMRFFIMYMPGLLESGRVYKSQPPLYGIEISKDKYKYFTYKIDYVKYIQNQFTKKNEVKYMNGKKISQNELSGILYTNIDYVYEVNRIANRYSIDAVLLESVLTLKDKPISELKRNLKKLFRFINVFNKNKVTVIEGAHNNKYQTLFLNDKLIYDCTNILTIMRKNKDLVYLLNDKPVSLYQLMDTFEKMSPSSIERYKGLGEMNGEKLFDSTVSPDNRTLIRYTIEDVNKELETIRHYESNKWELLVGVQVTRFDVM